MSIGIAEVLAAVATLRRTTTWSGAQVVIEPPSLGHGGADAALDRVAFLVANLPRRYSQGLGEALDAVTQGAIDTELADGILDVTGGADE